jgi:hypothetical protein
VTFRLPKHPSGKQRRIGPPPRYGVGMSRHRLRTWLRSTCSAGAPCCANSIAKGSSGFRPLPPRNHPGSYVRRWPAALGSLPLVCYRRARQSVSCWISTVGIHLRCMMWLEAIFCEEIPKHASIWLLPLQDRTAQHLQIPVSASDMPAKPSSKPMAPGATGCGSDAFNLQISRTRRRPPWRMALASASANEPPLALQKRMCPYGRRK